MSDELVSILITTYHDKQFLADCVDSILAQTYKNFELLIWDRSSSKDSAEIIKSYQNDKIFYFCKPLSVQDAIIELFSLARGKYIKLFCADDVMHPKCIELLMNELIANSTCAAVFSSMKTMNHEGRLNKGDVLFSEQFVDDYSRVESILFSRSHLLYPTAMINRSKIGSDIFDRRFSQVFDVRMWLGIILCYQGKIRCIDEELVTYRLRKGNGNMSDSSNKITMFRLIYESQQLINFTLEQIKEDNIFKIFPKARSVLVDPNLSFEKKYIPSILSVYFLSTNLPTFYGISIAKRFAIDTLFQQMKDIEIEKFLSKNCGYSLQNMKSDIAEYFKESYPSYLKKCISMFFYYLNNKGLWFTLKKTYFYFNR